MKDDKIHTTLPTEIIFFRHEVCTYHIPSIIWMFFINAERLLIDQECNVYNRNSQFSI